MHRTVLAVVMTAACGAHRGPSMAQLTLTAQSGITLPVEIAGRSLRFQLDTGASASALTPATAKLPGLAAGGDTVEAHGAGGAIDGARVVPVRELRVAGRVIRNLSVAVMDFHEPGGNTIDGVLGQDVLQQFTAEIDLVNRHIVLHDAASTGWRTGDLVATTYTMPSGLLEVAGTLDHQPITAVVDLGADATIANGKAAPQATTMIPAAAGVGADGKPLAVRQFATKQLAVGALEFGGAKILVADLPVFGVLGMADRPALILGRDVLANRRLIIEPATKSIHISKPIGAVQSPAPR